MRPPFIFAADAYESASGVNAPTLVAEPLTLDGGKPERWSALVAQSSRFWPWHAS